MRGRGHGRVRRWAILAFAAALLVACGPDAQVSDDRLTELREQRDALEQEVALLAEIRALERQLDVEVPPDGESGFEAEIPLDAGDADIDALRHQLYRLRTEIALEQVDEHPPGASVTLSGFPVDRLNEAREVADRLRPAVLLFDAEFGQTSAGQATAFLIEPDLAVTNQHNVGGAHGGATSIVLRSIDGEQFGATVIGEDEAHDTAVLRLDRPAGLPTIPWGDARDLDAGDPVMSIGHPGRMGSWVIAVGTFERLEGSVINVQLLGQAGSSGSPVVDLDGRLVGLYFGADFEISPMEPSPLGIHSVVMRTAAETGLATASHEVRRLVEAFVAQE